ncbi:MAG: type II toxin-antitoxin system RelE/ParE family toxin [Treponemataceae bacterium]
MYQVKIQESVEKQLKKMDKQTQRVIKNWIIKNLVDTKNPRQHGKALTGNLQGIWRYRVGDYRLFATIEDEKLTIFLFDVGHRREVYKHR